MKLVVLLSIVVVTVWAGPVEKPKLKGAVLLTAPYFKRGLDEKSIIGTAVVLLDHIANETGIEYELYVAPDGLHGVRRDDGTWNGLIGEVTSGKADFALADLTINEQRSSAVDFTVPFHTTQLWALIHRKYAAGMTNLKDLAEKPDGPTVGALANGATNHFLTTSQHETARKLKDKLRTENMANSNQEGFERVAKGDTPFAYIGESDSIQYYLRLNKNDNLIVLKDKEEMHPRHYGIALPKGSPYLGKFNAAIQKYH